MLLVINDGTLSCKTFSNSCSCFHYYSMKLYNFFAVHECRSCGYVHTSMYHWINMNNLCSFRLGFLLKNEYSLFSFKKNDWSIQWFEWLQNIFKSACSKIYFLTLLGVKDKFWNFNQKEKNLHPTKHYC